MARIHIIKSSSSEIEINSLPESIWENIMNVKIEPLSDPLFFRLLDIPKPLRAEVISEGAGGSRIAYFNNGKRFMQKILIWNPLKEYSFSFNPEKGFKVFYFFDLSEGIFRIPHGAYYLNTKPYSTKLRLETTYSIDRRFYFLLFLPVRLVLKIFQKYLLSTIKKNSEP
jgi:hypothetical protein